jgi:hypothetical protein
METLDNIGIKLFVLAARKKLYLYLSLFVCLRCVVPVSVHYRLCIVRVRMKELQMGGLTDFQRGQIFGARLS